MLLSSVNFVAKPKTGKKDKSSKKGEKKEEAVPFTCEQCIKEVEEEQRIFKFPATPSRCSGTSSSSSGYASDDCFEQCRSVGDRVTIVTGDDRCLSVEQFYYTIVLKEESRSDNTCIFRKKVLEMKPISNGHVETVVFALDCDQEFYITSSQHGDLELNYFMDDPSLEKPDERQFVVYHTDIGHCFIQPKLLKNMYLHHLDDSLSVQSLDFNYRCPEEYFFHYNAVPEPIPRKLDIVKACTHRREPVEAKSISEGKKCLTTSQHETNGKTTNKKEDDDAKIHNRTNSKVTDGLLGHKDGHMPKHFELDISAYKMSKKKNFVSLLIFGCFGGRSGHLTTSEV